MCRKCAGGGRSGGPPAKTQPYQILVVSGGPDRAAEGHRACKSESPLRVVIGVPISVDLRRRRLRRPPSSAALRGTFGHFEAPRHIRSL
eukprot:1194155-Prorocentrum_minimum.AAC.4